MYYVFSNNTNKGLIMYSYQLQFIISMISKIKDVDDFIQPKFSFTVELSESDDYTQDMKEACKRLVESGLSFKVKDNKLTIYGGY